MSRPLDLPPYAGLLGISVDHWTGNMPVLRLDYADDLGGNPGMFHGGVIAGLLDLAVLSALQAGEAGHVAAPLSTTIQFLRVATARPVFASAEVVRAGKRLASLTARAWQDAPDRPVAIALAATRPG